VDWTIQPRQYQLLIRGQLEIDTGGVILRPTVALALVGFDAMLRVLREVQSRAH
jgi:hypothetical protein